MDDLPSFLFFSSFLPIEKTGSYLLKLPTRNWMTNNYPNLSLYPPSKQNELIQPIHLPTCQWPA
jgi:hypothetical protein